MNHGREPAKIALGLLKLTVPPRWHPSSHGCACHFRGRRAGGMVDRVEIAEMMNRVVGRLLQAEDTDDVPPGPEGLATMFADHDQHGFHGGNSLVLQAILHREPRSVADFIAELVR